MSISYQPQNGRPVVRSIQVTPQWVANTVKTAATQPAAPVSYSVTVTDSGDAGTPTSVGTPSRNINRSGTPQLFISWQADDPDSDKLIYSVWYRAEDEYMWKLLKRDIAENTLLQEARSCRRALLLPCRRLGPAGQQCRFGQGRRIDQPAGPGRSDPAATDAGHSAPHR